MTDTTTPTDDKHSTVAGQSSPEKQPEATAQQVFTFRRMSGLNQAILATDWDWRHLEELDQKLWMAMSCPVRGLEFDSKTLALLDSDGDGRIRAADILEAVAWVCERVRHPSRLNEGGNELPLDNLRDDTEAGRELLTAARLVREKSPGGSQNCLEPKQIETVLEEAEGYAFNGDGIIPLDSVPEGREKIANFVKTAFAVVGAKRDAADKPGLDTDLAAEFIKRLQATRDFRKKVSGATLPLGENTVAAWTLLTRLGPKLDDYFSRCRMADFAPATLAALNEDALLGNVDIARENGVAKGAQGAELLKENLAATLLEMPIARIAAQKPLPLQQGINPAWQTEINEFKTLCAPLLPKGARTDSLTEESWHKIRDEFSSYAAALESKPVYETPPADATRVELPDFPLLALAPADDPLKRVYMPVTPNDNLDKLDDARLDELLDPDLLKDFDALAQQDLSAPKMTSLQDLDKLALFHAHLYTLLMNFVSFVDFYEPRKRAIFQVGTLYLDSRACLLCVPVGDLETHVRLATQSHLCLVYCQCQRKMEDGSTATDMIAAALTAGTPVSLVEGRHGLFVDNEGREWDCKIIRLVHNPISLREAVWAPYIRFGNIVGERIQKFIGSQQEAISKSLETAAANVGAAARTGEKQSFDFAKGAGIFAAVSVAISVLGAAFAYIANSVAALGWWWPLALLGIFIAISGPSVLIAWLKLRKRSLGPLLDASDWAVNQGAPINMVMGHALTSVGKMPPNAKCDLNDPYSMTARMRKRQRRIWFWFWVVLLLALIVAGCILYCRLFGLPAWFTQLAQDCGLALQ